MKNSRTISLVLALCVLMLNVAIAYGAEKPTSITIGYMDFDKPPFWWANNKIGADLDLIRMAAEKLGIAVNFRSIPWKRCQKELKENKLDGIIGASFKKSRAKIGKYPYKSDGKADDSAALHLDGYTFYKRKGDPVNYDGNQFTGLTGKIGANSGASIVDKLKKKGITNISDSAKTTGQNLRMLNVGRYQVTVDSGVRADFYLNTHPELAASIVKIPKPYGRSGRFLIFSNGFYQKYPEVADDMWSQIRGLRDSDEYNSLKLKHINRK